MEADPARAAARCGFGAPKPMRRARQRAASRGGAETHARREPHPMPIPPRAPSDWATVTGDLLKLLVYLHCTCTCTCTHARAALKLGYCFTDPNKALFGCASAICGTKGILQ